MREPKFRIWDKTHKQFRYWGFIEPGRGIFAGIPSSNSGLDLEYCRENSQMFTGLHDKNGKEIWEGDRVIDHNGRGTIEYVDKYAAFRVNYHNGECKWFYHYLDSERKTIEVIGNIYEKETL